LSRSRGFFIVLEGIDGAGKTTIAYKLIEYLERKGFEAIYTYEPYDSLYVKALKTQYNDIRDAYLDALTYAADRLVHLKIVILPSLMKGAMVVCDRYYYSSVAYQTAQGASMDWVLEINRYALKPDLAIYLDVDPETGLMRRRELYSRFPEYESLEFLSRVREVYLKLVEQNQLIYIDARRSFEEVYKSVLEKVDQLISGR